jgi:hypothetical protein
MIFLARVLLTSLVIAGASLLARRHAPLAAILASLPLTSLLTILWLYHDTRDGRLAGELATQIFWALLPTLFFFILFPWLLRSGVRFSLAMLVAILVMLVGYAAYAALLRRLGVGL